MSFQISAVTQGWLILALVVLCGMWSLAASWKVVLKLFQSSSVVAQCVFWLYHGCTEVHCHFPEAGPVCFSIDRDLVLSLFLLGGIDDELIVWDVVIWETSYNPPGNELWASLSSTDPGCYPLWWVPVPTVQGHGHLSSRGSHGEGLGNGLWAWELALLSASPILGS